MTDPAEPEAPQIPAPVVKYTVATSDFNDPNIRKVESATVRESRNRLKQIALFYMGRPDTEPKAEPTSIKLSTFQKLDRGGFDFDHPLERWNGNSADVNVLRKVLTDKFSSSGSFVADPAGSLAAASKALEESGLPADQISGLMSAIAQSPDAQELFATTDAARVLADSVNLARHRAVVDALETAALEASTSEGDLQKILEKDWWIFGGRYAGTSLRRALTILDQMDVPLIRNDGALHVVELKKAYAPDAIVEYRNHKALGVETARAVNQAVNYLRALDEQRAQIKVEFGIETRRATATVVMAHTSHVPNRFRDYVEETFRTFSSQLSRIELVTYDTLIAGARQALSLDS